MLRKQSPRTAFFAGSRQLQSELIGLSLPPMTGEQCAFLASELERGGCLSMIDVASETDAAEQFCVLTIHAHAALLREAGFFFPEAAELLAPQPGGSGLAVALSKIPSGSELSAELFQRLARLCAQTAIDGTPAEDWIADLRREIAKIPLPIAAAAHMARAGYELEIPLLEMHGTFLQAGYGANGVALSGSITENTSSIGVHFAREKSKANALLARAGFPVAEGGLVRDLAHAHQRAEALGYPVVVKPADRDGGIAVSSDIRAPAELEEAFARARAASSQVMVEKHIDGTDYRLLLSDNELLVAIERTPGGVTGNGKDTVAHLLGALNQDPKRGDAPNALLHKIAFDDEARLMLQRQGFTLESIPERGRFVPLRRAANHALGGAVRLVDDIHPDNVDLARRAMRLLGLDIAGLDLILPDVTRSWREAGGVICEVNAQPYIGEVVGRDYYKEILRKFVPNGGRIPLALALGTLDAKTFDKLAQVPGLTIVDAAGARRGGHPLSVAGMPWLTACQAALYDRETAAALFILDSGQPAPRLSPADRFTAALVLEAPPGGAETLLRRADTIHALDTAGPALKGAGLKFKTLQKADVAKTLAGLLGGAIPADARPKPAPRGTAPPAPRKRR